MAHTLNQPPKPTHLKPTVTGHSIGKGQGISFSQGTVKGKEEEVGRMLIGDIVANALSSVGVTDERVSKWMGKPCACKERREKLNQLERWALRVFGFKNIPLSDAEKAAKEAQAKADLEKLTGEGTP